MGFNSVYGILQELFPQVDPRLLKAAAIEHPKDPDEAVEFFLNNVILHTTEQSDTSTSMNQNVGSSVERKRKFSSACDSSSKHEPAAAKESANGSGELNPPYHMDPPSLSETVKNPLGSASCDAKHISDQLSGSTKGKELTTSKTCEETGRKAVKDVSVNDAVSPGSVKDPLGSASCGAKDISDQLSRSTKGKELTTSKTCDISDQLSRSTKGKELTTSKTCEETGHKAVEDASVNVAVPPPSVKDPVGSTPCDAKDISDQLCRSTKGKELTTSKTCEETSHKAVEDVSVNDAVSPTLKVQNGDGNQEFENSGFRETSKWPIYEELDLPTVPHSALSTSAILEDAVSDVSLKNKQSVSFDAEDDHLSGNQNRAVPTESQNKKQPNFDGDSLYGSNYVELSSLSVKSDKMKYLDCSIQSDVERSKSTFKFEIPEFSCAADAASKDIRGPGNANIEESSGAPSTVTLSGQVYSTDLLEDLIEESKSHKENLFSDMESVLKLTREVEFEEKVTEQAKQEALRGGLEIHATVNELKSMLNYAREANDMHSGEVYGERAILATEMRELQSRLLALSDLKENSQSILDVMRQALEARLTVAETERITAEQEKYEREESARKALAEQELIMEKVVQESKILQQEAEENAKLREFLVDRGSVVDVLQGEISVICQDIKVLKEKFDNHVPLSQSLSSEQTSCILASSGSTRKSTESEQVLEHAKSSSDEPILVPVVDKSITSTHKELLDEGWELFEDAAAA